MRLTVNELGSVEDAFVVEGIGYGCDEEALKAIRNASSLGFEPAMINGRAVKVQFDMPVKFKLGV